LGRLLGGRPITFIRVDDLKKQGYWGSAAFSWWVFWGLRADRSAAKLWDYFSQGKSQNG
jgi:hypothetical protein